MGIDIKITAGRDKGSSAVTATGSVQHIITEKEIGTFKVGDEALKNAVEKYFGKKPNDVYLKSPTNHDLYKRYGWEQVQTLLVAKSATIVSLTSEPKIIASEKFSNNSSKSGDFDIKITDSVTETVSNTWSQTNTIEVGQKITYGVTIEGVASVGGETSFSYQTSWGEAVTKSKSVTVGTETGVSVRLEPHESIIAELTASQGSLKTQIIYEASLIGQVAVNYSSKYRGHHFWGLPVANILSAAGINNKMRFTEEIDVNFYANGTVLIKDASGKIIEEFSAANLPGEISDDEYQELTKAKAA